MNPKYPGYDCCHPALVTSFRASLRSSNQEVELRYRVPTHTQPVTSSACWAHLSILSFQPVFIASLIKLVKNQSLVWPKVCLKQCRRMRVLGPTLKQATRGPWRCFSLHVVHLYMHSMVLIDDVSPDFSSGFKRDIYNGKFYIMVTCQKQNYSQ